MTRLLFWILLLAVGSWLWRYLPRDSRLSRRGRGNGAPPPEPMVRCSQCGTHVPQSGSINAQGQHFCCIGHARQYAEQNDF